MSEIKEVGRHVAPVFIGSCFHAIDTMRRAGMDDTAIASCLMEIRMAAITEHRLDRMQVDQENPIQQPRPSDILRYLDSLRQ